MNDEVRLAKEVRVHPVEEWLEQAQELAQAYSLEVLGHDPKANTNDVTTIYLAASTLWRTSEGEPCWSKFDPEAFREDLERNGVPVGAIENMLITVYTLYCYLAEHDLLAPELALAAQDRIVPHVRDCVRRLAADNPMLEGHPILAERGAWPVAPASGAKTMLN